jgi:hypothetical protein
MTNTIQTQDFYCSAYLIAVGIDLVSFSQSKDRTTFEFPDIQSTREHITKYYSLAALINPIAYGNAIRNLKSVIYANTDLNKPEKTYVKPHTKVAYTIGQR